MSINKPVWETKGGLKFITTAVALLAESESEFIQLEQQSVQHQMCGTFPISAKGGLPRKGLG